MSTKDLVEILESWRTALREVDAATAGSPEQAAAAARADQRRLEYRAAALRLKAHTDQVEGAIEATRERLGSSRATIDDARQVKSEIAKRDT